MNRAPEPLLVRQHERLHCRLPAMVRVHEDLREQVVLARTAADAQGAVAMNIVDCSKGGLGLESRVFLPRGARLRLKLAELGTSGEVVLRVQRVTMLDRTPTYYLGVSFVGSDELHQRGAAEILERARAGTPGAPSASNSGGSTPQGGAR